jgi:thiol-disulfide isomerase/thioredoxin
MAKRALIVWALLLLGFVTAPAGSGLRLEDPRTGKEVTVGPGARALHLVFFATWCPPCVEELERLAELKARWGDRGYRLVIVALQTRHTASRLAGFADGREVPGEFLFDAEGRAERAWKAGEVPTHVVLDASGKEVARSGSLDDGIESALERLLAVRRGAGGGP